MADVEVSEEIKIKLTEPKKWKVVILNDDVTPIDFVIAMLMEIFNHSSENAYNITFNANMIINPTEYSNLYTYI